MLRRIILIVAVVGVLAFVGLFTGVNQAYADTFPSQDASTEGAQATCSLQTWTTYVPNDNAQIDCDLTDTLADHHSVYVEWWQDGFGHIQLRNDSGAGQTVHVSDARYNGDGSFGTAYFKVCRDIQFGPDNCSGTKSWAILQRFGGTVATLRNARQ
jgi:hypothetical protein